MRVTQSMLSTNMLRNLSNSYNKMATLQEQINSGKKITRPSQDPVVAIKGIGYRTDLNKVEQYQRNLGEVNNWLDSSDDALDKVGSALKRVQELVTDAANDTKTPEDREKIKVEITQLKAQIRDLANTKVGDKYIFSGTKTLSPLYDNNGNFLGETGVDGSVNIEVYDGVEIKVNTNGKIMFEDIDKMMENIESVLDSSKTPVATGPEIAKYLEDISGNQDTVLAARADIGARQNRVEMMEDRLGAQEIIVTKQLSSNEDIDYEKAITEMITQESIHRAALSVGARIIQPTLTDFLR
ncbi:flagellar hook-associated protein FlgL [Psychrobacillus lasiicapitis]|uniref:Flagellar hook-associated protein FlgL n=1 Tax=Psychrobacillus lasiicapitis TaxID=1636719 RepID=A0A544TE99_9BACI|nr:flagellar hook-associated protein FlgL [Psychrobacillus lasiicapitis]TQR15716.1 flagellar hook-associated protein FlgL [Psychrobacillus lasiicapitis]GGA18584.1 flagellar hook-associated protein 3 [Psychrobacillus lasiicapitis]